MWVSRTSNIPFLDLLGYLSLFILELPSHVTIHADNEPGLLQFLSVFLFLIGGNAFFVFLFLYFLLSWGRLSKCGVRGEGCHALASALGSNRHACLLLPLLLSFSIPTPFSLPPPVPGRVLPKHLFHGAISNSTPSAHSLPLNFHLLQVYIPLILLAVLVLHA